MADVSIRSDVQMQSEPFSELDEFATCVEEGLRVAPTYDEVDIFQVLKDFQECARKKAMDIADSDGDFQDNPEFVRAEVEARFWALAFELYSFRHSEPKPLIPEFEYSSKAIKQENQLRSNPKLRENWIILSWLQDTLVAPEEPKELRGSKWMYTKNAIKQAKSSDLINLAKSRDLGDLTKDDKKDIVTELDPDAPLRQQKRVVESDQLFDKTLHRYIFELLRARKFDEALQICELSGNFTLKLSISGANEYMDPQIDGKLMDLPDMGSKPRGIERKGLWKKMCLQLAQQTDLIDLYERGIYGILGGDLNSVISLCNTWETQFIAFMLFIVTNDVEEVEEDGESARYEPRKVLDILAKSSNPVVKEQSEDPIRTLMGAVINDSVEFIARDFATHLQSFANGSTGGTDFFILRIMAHLLVFLRQLDVPIGESIDYTVILRSYIEYLHFQKKQYLVPLYISHLPEEDSVNVYGSILSSITDPEQRKIHLKLAKKYGLDINNSIRKAVADVFEDTSRHYEMISSTSPTSVVDEADKRLYRTIEWFIDASLWADALHSVVNLYQLLLGKGKFEAAYEFGSKITGSTILKMYESNLTMNFDQTEFILDGNERVEILEYDKLISILSDFKLWNELLHEIRSSGRFVSSSNMPKIWREKMLTLVRELAAKITDFSQNWMVEIIRAYSDIDRDTAELLRGLRIHYVPFVILELARIYTEAQVIHPAFLKEAAHLSNMVASEDFKLYELFLESGNLGPFLDRMAEAVTDGVGDGEQGIYE